MRAYVASATGAPTEFSEINNNVGCKKFTERINAGKAAVINSARAQFVALHFFSIFVH